ncbi:5-hydroxyisourate hydrolase isoform X1 [Colossoma macropomum]|uniref:5-hydroxyisourate hydrolase isoform X1 n=1 Tax=Colossoma macropomum TaxID=42526 RepID=UPI0018641AB1|nr:5-hydroxyisourate hydrolase isoform X1 [Colossoma macropomum]XP_036440777.1 5-hydroxyisourate hydrolase isoform X1 [Colossoma macropomum]XP_036440778.1 5-hydroxyisourate hydrolase isoform X1 [Colossoma macropomum]
MSVRLQHIKHHIFAANQCAEMTAPLLSPLTTHVLNTGRGIPAANMNLSLYLLDATSSSWNLLRTGATNDDGRSPGLISKEAFIPGVYKMRFETGQYWEALGETCFYPYVEIVFTITDASQKFHVPLLLSRFSYSTYRGS